MAKTITKGATTITPTQVLGYETETQSRNIFHDILNRPAHDTSLRDDTLRSGTLRLLFESETAASEAFQFHTTAGVFSLNYDDFSTIEMLYVREGRMRLALDSDSLILWVLEVGYREVTP